MSNTAAGVPFRVWAGRFQRPAGPTPRCPSHTCPTAMLLGPRPSRSASSRPACPLKPRDRRAGGVTARDRARRLPRHRPQGWCSRSALQPPRQRSDIPLPVHRRGSGPAALTLRLASVRHTTVSTTLRIELRSSHRFSAVGAGQRLRRFGWSRRPSSRA
jgi:hypothetical protein